LKSLQHYLFGIHKDSKMQGTIAKSDRMEDDTCSSDLCVDSGNKLGYSSKGAAATEDAPVQDQNLKYVQQWILVYALPFFYGAITRLPFIYFVIHMRMTFDLDWLSIGFYVGSYQATRVATSVVAIFAPKLAHFSGTSIGLAGNLVVLLSNSNDKTPFIVGTILVGFSETLACMQTYTKSVFDSDLTVLEHKLKVQYAAVMVGVTFAFGLGGFIYQRFGIDGVAIFGVAMSVFELLSLLAYFLLEMKPLVDESVTKRTDRCTSTNSSESSQDDNVGKSTFSVRKGDEMVAALDFFLGSGMGANYLSYILCITFGMESITIGYNLAISPIFITEQFGKSTVVIGIMLGAGAGFGTLVSILMTLTNHGKTLMEKYLPSPYNLFVAMGGISVSVLLASVPSFPVHVIGILFLMGFNDLAALILNEMQGTITTSRAYSAIGPMGQVVRRSFNVITAVTGPLLFSVLPQLPYIVAGVVTALWTLVLVIVIKHRMRSNRKVLDTDDVPRASLRDFKQMSFTRQEIIAREKKRGILVIHIAAA
jgi:hypothetical protein